MDKISSRQVCGALLAVLAVASLPVDACNLAGAAPIVLVPMHVGVLPSERSTARRGRSREKVDPTRTFDSSRPATTAGLVRPCDSRQRTWQTGRRSACSSRTDR
jgi:hypothetical protein